MTRKLQTRPERLVRELDELREKRHQFEKWRRMASVNLYRATLFTREVRTTSVLGFKHVGVEDQETRLPDYITDEFHSFLALSRDKYDTRIREIELELEGMSDEHAG